MTIATTAPEIQAEDLGRTPVPGARRFSLTSRRVPHTFVVDVARPALPPSGGGSLPVIYVLDGDYAFALTTQIARMLQTDATPLPPALIVGVGYRYGDGAPMRGQQVANRTRDFTPTADVAYLDVLRAALAHEKLEVELSTGGAAAFTAFLVDELRPWLASRYPINPQDQTLVGMSLGGFYVLHTLFTAPSAFQRYVAASPAIWWDDGLLFREEAALADRVRDLPASVFLSVGRKENNLAPYRELTNLRRMARTLESRGYAGLRVSHHLFADETHMSVFPAAVSRGLRSVFA